MPLRRSTAAPSVVRALAAGLREFADLAGPVISSLPAAWVGFNVFTLEIPQLANGLGGAAEVGWRFVSPNQDVAADVVGASDQQPRMISLLRYGDDDRPLQALTEAEALLEGYDTAYQLRVLRIPGILLEAFWLIPADGGSQLLIPIRTGSSRLARMKAYPVGGFLEIARTLAAEFLKFDQLEEN